MSLKCINIMQGMLTSFGISQQHFPSAIVVARMRVMRMKRGLEAEVKATRNFILRYWNEDQFIVQNEIAS